jgi:hypothetical protein
MCSIASSSESSLPPPSPTWSISPSWSFEPGQSAELDSLFDCLDAAALVDDYASLLDFSSPLSPAMTKRIDQLMDLQPPLKPTSSSTLFAFDDLRFDDYPVDTEMNPLEVKDEEPLPLVTSSSCADDVPQLAPTLSSSVDLLPPQSSSSGGGGCLKLRVPCVPKAECLYVSTSYFARPLPGESDLFLAAQIQPPRSRMVKRKRAAVADEVCATDGVLFNFLIEQCSSKKNKAPLEHQQGGIEKKLECKSNRTSAKLKLELKRRKCDSNFNGHYPERKAVASSRKRVGGRFVKENKSVFRPVLQQNTVTV